MGWQKSYILFFGKFGDRYRAWLVGEGLSEMRIHYGPGYRVYYKDTGREIIILLCGGDKSTQQADIAKAQRLAKLPLKGYEEEHDGKNN